MSRRYRLVVPLTVVALALAACSTGATDAEDAADPEPVTDVDPDAFPVTIKHAYGETTIEEEPQRVATLGWSDQDIALSLGVIPVGAVKITWGGNSQDSTPWYDAKLAELDGDQPTRYSDTDGAPIEEIAKLSPDLILATNSGITQQEYDKLSKLAKVIPYPGEPWVTTWQESLAMAGQALGRSELADQVQAETEESLAAAAEEYPELVGSTFIFAALTTLDMSKIDYYTPEDNRPRLLTDLGMVNAPIIEQISKPGQFYGTISADRAPDLESDVFITYAETKDDLDKFRADPLLGQIPGIESGHVLASTDKTDALGLSAPSPLAIPYAMEHFVPLVADALDGIS
jgi:iron complex transport system substrate-binding protein